MADKPHHPQNSGTKTWGESTTTQQPTQKAKSRAVASPKPNDDDSRPDEKTPKGWHQFWQKEFDAANKRLRQFRKQGNAVNGRFLDERSSSDISISGIPSRLNLFHKNVKTLCNMLYGQTPRADVSREHQDPDDDIARVASYLIQRLIEADYEPSGEDVSTVLKAVLQDRLIPGLGVARVRYEVETAPQNTINPETLEIEAVEQVVSEDAPIDYVHWQDVMWGWGRTWDEIPWWGFRSWLTKTEARKRFGAKIADNLDYENQLPSGSGENDHAIDTDQKDNVQKAEIWEFWQKNDRRVYWWSYGADLILDVKDDPLELRGFWPIPRPLTANVTTTLFMPKADFVICQDLYNEIDELQSRISTITRAIKVVGVYDQNAGGSVGRMLKEGVENDLIPVENWAMFAEKGGLSGSIDWFPVQEVVGTLQTLVQIQENKISQLNEITGMSEIMRGGAGGQYTAAASNQMAAKMGSIDVQAMQDEFARFASDIEALKAEVIAKHFEPQTILRQSNAQFVPEADKQLIMPAVELIKSPDSVWRITIRPESIAMIDYAQLKSERTEFLTAMATYIQSATSAVQAVPGSLPILLEMMKWGMAGFKGSDYLEGTMDQAIDMAKKAPPEGKDDGKAQDSQIKLQIEQMKMQAQQQKAQAEMQKMQMKAKFDMQLMQQKLQLEVQKIQADSQADLTFEQVQAQNRMLEIAKELEANIAEVQANLDADLTIERAQAQYDIESQSYEHANNMRELQAQYEVKEESEED